MKIIGYFRNLSEKLYRVEIDTQTGTGTKEITLGGNPFITQMDGSDKTIYYPVKGQSATIEAYIPDFLLEIYTGYSIGSQVTLYSDSDNSIEWTGFIEPCLYSQAFTYEKETIEINAIDFPSACKNIPYRTNSKQIISIAEVFYKIYSKQDKIRYIYVSDNVQVNENGMENPFEKFKVNETAFFQKKSDTTQTDDDVAWDCGKVMEEILRWLGYTLFQYKDSVYIVDYDAIAKGDAYYYRYDLKNWNSGAVAMYVNHTLKINGDHYYNSDAVFSLDNVFDKVSVKDSYYSFDNIIGDIYDQAENITVEDPTIQKIVQEGGPSSDYVYPMGVCMKDNTQYDGNNRKMLAFLQKNSYGIFSFVAMKYYKPRDGVRLVLYNPTNNQQITGTAVIPMEQCNYTYTANQRGTFMIKAYSKYLSQPYYTGLTSAMVDFYRGGNPSDIEYTTSYLEAVLYKNDIHSLSLSNYIMVLNPTNGYNIGNDNQPNYPVLEFTPNPVSFGNENNYILIQGSFQYQSEDTDRYPYDSETAKKTGEKIKNNKNAWKGTADNAKTFLYCSLQIGNNAWDGEGWIKITDKAPTFKVNYWIPSNHKQDENRVKATYGKTFEIINTVTAFMGITEKGYAIPVPNTISGDVIFKTYLPTNTIVESTQGGHYKGTQCLGKVCCFKDLNLKFIISDPTYSGDLNTDTIYTNEIDRDNAVSLSQITFNICTDDNKKANYNSVYYGNGNVNKTFNKALSKLQNSTDWNGGKSTDGMRQEEHLIWKIVNQYSEPSSILEANYKEGLIVPYGCYTDTTLTDKKFIVDCVGYDYKKQNNQVKLIEKK